MSDLVDLFACWGKGGGGFWLLPCGQKGPGVSLVPSQVYPQHRRGGEGQFQSFQHPHNNFDSLHIDGTLLWFPISCCDVQGDERERWKHLGYPPTPLSYISLLGANLCLLTAEESHASREVSFSQELGR